MGRIARLRRLTGRQPIGQQAKALKHRVGLAVVTVGVAHIGEIALVPDVAHGLDLLWGVGEPARKPQPSRHGSLWGMSINAAADRATARRTGQRRCGCAACCGAQHPEG